MTHQQELQVLKSQVKALMEVKPKIINQSVFMNTGGDVVGAYITSAGEARLTAAPLAECETDSDSWTTPMEYGSGYSLGFGYDPRGWQNSYIHKDTPRKTLKTMFPVQFNRYQYLSNL